MWSNAAREQKSLETPAIGYRTLDYQVNKINTYITHDLQQSTMDSIIKISSSSLAQQPMSVKAYLYPLVGLAFSD